ncbi:MAG TPA: DoxX family protein [Candidatus Obscuribacterales bacterium]
MADTELPDRWFKPAFQTLLQDLGLLLLRLSAGVLMLSHGLPKWAHYAEKAHKFPDPLHIGSPLSLGLAIFAEVLCAALVMLGLGTRLASLVVVINFAVIVQIVHAGDPLGDKELAVFYLLAYAVLLLMGPGRFALDMAIKRLLDRPTPKQSKSPKAPTKTLASDH